MALPGFTHIQLYCCVAFYHSFCPKHTHLVNTIKSEKQWKCLVIFTALTCCTNETHEGCRKTMYTLFSLLVLWRLCGTLSKESGPKGRRIWWQHRLRRSSTLSPENTTSICLVLPDVDATSCVSDRTAHVAAFQTWSVMLRGCCHLYLKPSLLC